jgi:hypothetical protein
MKKIIILFIITCLLSIFYYENRNLIISNKINNIGINAYINELYVIWIGQFNLANNTKKDAVILYNIWNTHYKIAEEKNNENEKIAYYELALDSYSWSLNIDYNQDTKYNYEYVEQKLDKLLNTEQEEQETKLDEESTENQEWEEINPASGKEQEWDITEESKEVTEWEEKKWEENSNWNDWSNWKEWSWEWEWTNETEELSQEQLEQIEKYSEDLKKTEFYNQKYFNKVNHNELNDKSYDELMDIFERWWEKDW